MYMLNALTFKYWRLINALVGQTKQFASEAAILQPWAKGTEVWFLGFLRSIQKLWGLEFWNITINLISNGKDRQGKWKYFSTLTVSP